MASIGLNSTLVKSVMLKVIGDGGDANRMLDELAAKAEALQAEHPEMTVQINRAKAMADAVVMKAEMAKLLNEDPVKLKIEPDAQFFHTELDKLGQDILAGAPGSESPLNKGNLGQDVVTLERDFLGLHHASENLGAFWGRLFGSGGSTGVMQTGLYDLLRVFSLGKLPGLGGAVAGAGGGAGAAAAGGEEAAAAGGEGGLGLAPSAGPAILAGAVPVGGAILNIVGALGAGLAAASQGLISFGALAYPEFDTLLTAVGKGKAGLKGLNKEQQDIVQGALNIENEYQRLAAKLAPSVDKILSVFTMKGGIGSQILQDLLPFAQAAAPAILKLAESFNKWLASPGAEQFQKLMIRLVPGTITAIGEGIGKVAIAIGKFLEVFSHGNEPIHVINGIFDAIVGLIDFVTTTTARWNKNWDQMTHDVSAWYGDVKKFLVRAMSDLANWAQDVDNWLHRVRVWWDNLPGQIVSALGKLPGDLISLGEHAVDGLITGFENRIGSLFSDALSWGKRIANDIGSVFGIHFNSPPSEATYMIQAGRNISDGLARGILSGRGVVTSAFGSLGIGGAGGGVALSVQASGDQFSQFLALMIRQYVRVHGGGGPSSVQRALGTGVA